MIPFSRPSITELEKQYALDSMSGRFCGDNKYTRKVCEKFKDMLGIEQMLLVTSCSTALDMSAMLLDIGVGDEVICPSFTFVSTANSIVLRGAKPVFCDVRPDTMNMDERLIESLITDKTKAIYPVHYAGVCCDMDYINDIAKKYNLKVVEDAAQAVGSTYRGKIAGTLSDMGCYSFHETKNYVMGEGGCLIIKDKELFEKAEMIREKGTDRNKFYRGEVDKYTWRCAGSSYLPSDVLAAVLYGQLERFDEIMDKRLHIWNMYHHAFESLEKTINVMRPHVPDYATHNGHIYYLMCRTEEERSNLISYLNKREIGAVFHYIPLHSSPFGKSLGYSEKDCPITEEYSRRLIRLPLCYELSDEDVSFVIKSVYDFYEM